MKKKLAFSSVLLLFLFVLTACGQTNKDNSQTSTTTDKSNAALNPSRNNRPDFGQPDRASDIRGLVKSILGNEVNVLKVEMPNRQASSTEATNTENNNTKKEAGVSLTTTGVPAGGGAGMGMGMGMGGGPGGAGGQTADSRAQMLETLKAMSSGEEKVIIPVGIKMLKFSSENGSREMIEANLSDITADKMITIWLNQSVTDKKVAEFVLIN
ncbi:MAG: hypothetical protein HY931_01860 [Candidatus Falkowbacteria bacterium]|nr:MAG: hypothetical protein HY931_01860 [Candidatus Falkowbacteria bacterium]